MKPKKNQPEYVTIRGEKLKTFLQQLSGIIPPDREVTTSQSGTQIFFQYADITITIGRAAR